jgi:hypothetical protein
MAHVDTLKRLFGSAAALIAFSTALAVDAQTLPVIVDATGAEPAAWWAATDVAPVGSLDAVLFALPGVFTSPLTTQPDAAPSSLLRRIDITANNARNLAGLYGADRVAVGRLERTGATLQPWLGLTRVGLRLTGELLDVATGASIAPLDVVAAAYDADPERAALAANRALAARLVALVPRETSGALVPPMQAPLTVIVQSWDTAAPYVAFRGILRDAHPGIVEVMESWAAEGRVALEVRLDEGADVGEVRTAIARLAGTVGEGARVASVEAAADALVVVVEPAPVQVAPVPTM